MLQLNPSLALYVAAARAAWMTLGYKFPQAPSLEQRLQAYEAAHGKVRERVMESPTLSLLLCPNIKRHEASRALLEETDATQAVDSQDGHPSHLALSGSSVETRTKPPHGPDSSEAQGDGLQARLLRRRWRWMSCVCGCTDAGAAGAAILLPSSGALLSSPGARP